MIISEIKKFKTSLVILFTMAIFSCNLYAGETVKIGWTHHTENAILGNMLTLLITKRIGAEVKTSPNLGGTGLAHQGMLSKQLDAYPDYTGDALSNILKHPPITNPDESFAFVKKEFIEKYNISWIAKTPFNNTYALALKEEVAAKHNIKTISDLAKQAPDWVIGCSVEFAKRPKDGYPGMSKFYGFKFDKVKSMDPGLMYSAAKGDQVDVIVAFATDARIGKFNLRVLEDDKMFFPAYNAALTAQKALLDSYPDLAPLVEEVFSSLDTVTMISLNGKVDIGKQSPGKVAETYLREKGYIK